MPVSVNWATGVILVPQSYLTPIGGLRYTLDVNQLRLDLKALEWSAVGMVFDDTHVQKTSEVLLSGTTYARIVVFGESQLYGTSRSSGLPSYTIEFEDVGSPYRVECTGANHNASDVQVVNDVSQVVNNSAGLVNPTLTGVDIATAVWDEVAADHETAGTFGYKIKLILSKIGTLFGL